MVHLQQTIKNPVTFSGIGVHSGIQSSVTVHPADEGTGIVFRHATAPKTMKVGTIVPVDAMHATVLKHEDWFISTVEHLLAAIWVLGIDNAVLEIRGNEIPILDGSALPFMQGLTDAGLVAQGLSKAWLTPKQTLTFADAHGRSLVIEPSLQNTHDLNVSYTTTFAHPLAGNGVWKGLITPEVFYTDLAPARTFGFLDQLPFLRHHKLAQGTSLGNTVVIGEELLNDMRMPDECVRHKVLDLIGDLSLLGTGLLGSIVAQKTSHNFNRLVIEHFIKHPEEWVVVN